MQIFRAVHDALTHDEFYDIREIAAAKRYRKSAWNAKERRRASAVAQGDRPRLVRLQAEDRRFDSTRPVVPASFARRRRSSALISGHGRGEKLSELQFSSNAEQPANSPPNAFTVSYGRYCANKFAGGSICLKREHAQNYPIDEPLGDMLRWAVPPRGVRGHYPGFFCAAPGAGFSERWSFSKSFKEDAKPTPFEQKLWGWYGVFVLRRQPLQFADDRWR